MYKKVTNKTLLLTFISIQVSGILPGRFNVGFYKVNCDTATALDIAVIKADVKAVERELRNGACSAEHYEYALRKSSRAFFDCRKKRYALIAKILMDNYKQHHDNRVSLILDSLKMEVQLCVLRGNNHNPYLAELLYKEGICDNSTFMNNSNIKMIKKLRSLGLKIDESTKCSQAIYKGNIDTLEFLLKNGCNSNNDKRSDSFPWEIFGKNYLHDVDTGNTKKITRLLLLYGCRVPDQNDHFIGMNSFLQKKLDKNLEQAFSKLTRYAIYGDIENFQKALAEKPQKKRQALLNSALRYAASNCRDNMVQYLLDEEANPFVQCPNVAKDVATTEGLIMRLSNREPSTSKFKELYDKILDLFKNHPKACYHRPRALYWQLRVFEENGLQDFIPRIILYLHPNLGLPLEKMESQVYSVEESFKAIHENRKAAKNKPN